MRKQKARFFMISVIYNFDKYMMDNKIKIKEKYKIYYCRFSSTKQKEDLERQIEFMKK